MPSRLQPFICYFGGKWRAAPRYPVPRYDTIVEPFAGGAGYALSYSDRKVVLYEIDPIIYQLWDYLIHVSPQEILALPSVVDHVDNIDASDGAKYLIGFWLNKGTSSPMKSPSAWARAGTHSNSYWGDRVKARIASQVEYIRHWRVYNQSYETAEDVEASWFVDPPYQVAGKNYRYRTIDYLALGTWCKERKGQVIVCENEGAEWLPFREFATIKSTPGTRGKGSSKEVIWTSPEPDNDYGDWSDTL